MSLVCFLFKEEDISVVVRNVELAASHPSVAVVLCVGFSKGVTWDAIESQRAGIQQRSGKAVRLLLQKRIGSSLRPGKGDGMNTALAYFLEHPEFKRIHFYDADIVSFSQQWITKAEQQAELGFDVVRHYFPRASTDAMVTWFVTRIGFCLLWPKSVLPLIEQPLGGELLLTRKAAELLYADPRVRNQSDWGIDTLFTFVMVQKGLHIAEVYIHQGKVHALYDGLQDLRTMLIECFAALQSLRLEAVHTQENSHQMEHPRPVPETLKQKLGFDVEKTLKLLASPWAARQKQLLREHFQPELVDGLLGSSEWPCWGFADEGAWVSAVRVLLAHFVKDDEDWEEILFRIWVTRVLNHTLRYALRGYDTAIDALRSFVWETQRLSALRLKQHKTSTTNGCHRAFGDADGDSTAPAAPCGGPESDGA